MSFDIFDRIVRAVAKVRERLLRATAALNTAGIPYAVIGGNAVASWVATVDEGAVRNTPGVDILVCRSDLGEITSALTAIGFVREEAMEIYRDGPDGKRREAVQLLFSGEKIRPEYLLPAPAIRTADDTANFRVIALDLLVEMKLVSNRTIDKVHIRDLIDVGLIDASRPAKLLTSLAERLTHILDTPNG